jgi:hypothetical protein
MALNGKKLVNYLAHNISPTQIAEAMGVTPGRITQLAQDARVVAAVEDRKKEIAEEGLTDIADLKSIKRKLVHRLSDLVDNTDSLGEAVRALKDIDAMTAQKLGQDDHTSGIGQIIMNAPTFLQINGGDVELDSNNRIVAIKGRSMAQMPTKGVLNILEGELA